MSRKQAGMTENRQKLKLSKAREEKRMETERKEKERKKKKERTAKEDKKDSMPSGKPPLVDRHMPPTRAPSSDDDAKRLASLFLFLCFFSKHRGKSQIAQSLSRKHHPYLLVVLLGCLTAFLKKLEKDDAGRAMRIGWNPWRVPKRV